MQQTVARRGSYMICFLRNSTQQRWSRQALAIN